MLVKLGKLAAMTLSLSSSPWRNFRFWSSLQSKVWAALFLLDRSNGCMCQSGKVEASQPEFLPELEHCGGYSPCLFQHSADPQENKAVHLVFSLCKLPCKLLCHALFATLVIAILIAMPPEGCLRTCEGVTLLLLALTVSPALTSTEEAGYLQSTLPGFQLLEAPPTGWFSCSAAVHLGTRPLRAAMPHEFLQLNYDRV